MKLEFDITLTKKQREAYNRLHSKDTRYLVARYSRQCGKTVLAETLLIEYLCKRNTFNAYISPTFSLGKKVYNDIVNLLEPTGIIKKANSSTLTIETVFGSTLQFFSVQSFTSIRGNTVRGLLVLDECAFFPDQLPDGSDIWANVIYPIIKANIKRNKCLIISTPAGKRGCFYKFHNNALNKVKGWYEIVATIYDDGLVDDEQLAEIRSNVTDLAFRQEFMVEFLDNGLTYFIGFEDCFQKFIYNNNLKCCIGIDLSANGKDETILTKINTNNEVKQYKIRGTLDQKYQKIADIINNTNNLMRVDIESNSIGAVMSNEIKKLVLKKNIIYEFNTTNNSKNQILSVVAMAIAKKSIMFDVDDKELYSQFSTFASKTSKNGNIQLEALPGYHDDRIMSLGIAKYSLDNATVKGHYTISFGKK